MESVQRSVVLENGTVLDELVIAYRVRGTLSPLKDNAILVEHGYTGGPDLISEGGDPLDGSLSALIGPGRPLDTDRFFLVAPNVIGSSHGSTSAASLDPGTGRPWGSNFPLVTVGDNVEAQKRLLRDEFGVDRLFAVVGASFGGLQALEWGIRFPDSVGGIVCASALPRMPGVDVASLRSGLETIPEFHSGDYYGRSDLTGLLRERRQAGLTAFGAREALADLLPGTDEQAISRAIETSAAAWAERFDVNSLIDVFRTMADYDAAPRLSRLRAPLLFALVNSDPVIPIGLAPKALAAMRAAGVDARYLEIDSTHGHLATSSDPEAWAAELREFLATLPLH